MGGGFNKLQQPVCQFFNNVTMSLTLTTSVSFLAVYHFKSVKPHLDTDITYQDYSLTYFDTVMFFITFDL